MNGVVNGVSESAGINRLGIENERVLRRTTYHRPWPQSLRRERGGSGQVLTES